MAKRNSLDEVRRLDSIPPKTITLTWHLPRSDRDKEIWHLPFTFAPGGCPLVETIAEIINEGPQREDYPNEAQRLKYDELKQKWVAHFLWVTQMELSHWRRHEWPFTLTYMRGWETSASVDFLELEMCKWLQDYLADYIDPDGFPYSNAFEHWKTIKLEEYLSEMECVDKPRPKNRALRAWDKEIRDDLENRVNPWKHSIEPERWNLLEVVIHLIKSTHHTSDLNIETLRSYYTRYEKAFKAGSKLIRGELHVADVRLALAHYFVDGDRLMLAEGRGAKQIYPEKKEVNAHKWRSGRGRKPAKI